jgi:hypothetical protein
MESYLPNIIFKGPLSGDPSMARRKLVLEIKKFKIEAMQIS